MLFIFDMGGVVTTTASDDIIENICKELAITKDDFYVFCNKGLENDLLKQMDNGILTPKEFWKIISTKVNKEINCDFWRIFFHPVLNKKVVKIIEKLKKQGHRVVCGTNTIYSHYDNHLSRGDYAFFDQTYTSVSLGVSKPEAEFWELILKAEGFSSNEAFFTDDKKENCKGAEKVGIFSYNYKDEKGLLLSIKEFLKQRK